MEQNNTATNPTSNQIFGCVTVSIMRSPSDNSSRWLKISDGRMVPVEIAALAAGRDAWMRNVEVRCINCREIHPIHELENNGRYCAKCQAIIEAEMEQINS